MGKRKYEDTGFSSGGQSLPRLEMPASMASSDNREQQRPTTPHRNHLNHTNVNLDNRLGSPSNLQRVSPKPESEYSSFKIQQSHTQQPSHVQMQSQVPSQMQSLSQSQPQTQSKTHQIHSHNEMPVEGNSYRVKFVLEKFVVKVN